MKKIILADDNLLVLESLDRMIKWEELGFRLVAKATNGEEALEAIKQHGIDILISDIKMPTMDGLTLIREIANLSMDCKIIMLSSYNDFQLVREAMRRNASEYILKTELDPVELTRILSHLAEQLDQEREMTRRVEMLESKPAAELMNHDESRHELYLHRRYIKDQLFRELCRGYLSEQQFLFRIKDYLNIRYEPGGHEMLYLSVDHFQKFLDGRWNGNETLFSFAIMNVMEEILQSVDGTDLFYSGSGDFVIVRSVRDQECLSPSGWGDLFHELTLALDQFLKIRISGGWSGMRLVMQPIPDLYVEAMKACQFRYILGKGKLITDQDIAHSIGTTISYPINSDRIGLLRNALTAFHPELLERTLETLCVKQEEVSLTNFNEVLRLYEKYSFVLMDFVEQNGFQAACGPMLESFNEIIYDREAVPELNARLKDAVTRIARNMETGNSHVRQLIKYMQGHLAQKITLQSAAEQLGVSSPYLGRLIQKELGISFNEYLNQHRIERAKELLIEGHQKIYEIAEQVGYASTEYFSRMFKKVVGVNPLDYSLGKYE
ncbi:MAG: response regulator [Paenibacillaceae bacterium]|nr:response regulator [Paenibacillaceae bacterium]